MFELNKRLTILVCFICSVVGLVLIYYISASTQPKEIEIGEIKPDLVGHFISTKGTVSSKTLTKGGHLFLTINDGKDKLQVVMFSTFLTKEKISPSKFSKGTKVVINGILEEYKGQLQIVPKKSSDVSVLR